MESPARTPRVLVIGLDPHRVPGPRDPEPMAKRIEVGRARSTEHGVPAEFCLLGLDGSGDVETVVSAALSGRTWECVVVGGARVVPGDPVADQPSCASASRTPPWKVG